jgi:multidrug efflux system membrane fusion protein
MTETEASTQETGSSDEPNPTPFAALLRHWKIALLAVCLLAIGVYIFWTKSGEGRSRAAVQGATASVPAVPVATVAAKTGSIPVYLTGLGSVTPLNTVTVKTQVNGQLISVRYQEGQLVRVGDLLAEIDPRPFQAQLTQFEGQLVRDQALLDNARLDLKRFTVLVEENSIPRQQYDTQVSLVHQLEGTVKNDQGLIQGVKVQLIYTRITAPGQRAGRAAPGGSGKLRANDRHQWAGCDHPTAADHGYLYYPGGQHSAGARQAQAWGSAARRGV